MKINWLKFKYLYFTISGTLIISSIISLVMFGLELGLEFRGGSELRISSEEKPSFEDERLNNIQEIGEKSYLLRFEQIGSEEKNEILEKLGEGVTEESFQTVGPSIGPELIKKTFVAIAVAAGSILLWVAIQFKSIKFGASAILAMLHDSFILIGSFSLLGHFYGAEIDFLFVTAVLTTLSFSVHDTIVVFDRIREIQKGDSDIEAIANKAVSETMRRSIINSLTIIFMLLALVILGGITVRWFATSLLIGAILGTYSSPFVAVPILVTWEKFRKK